ncbi:MAG: hypothetical protein K0S33_1464 [Bacteroidetes bacterium]|jgi:hypothetical protein|nr:hypothetical protein [Bacteroidota bacterium]
MKKLIPFTFLLLLFSFKVKAQEQGKLFLSFDIEYTRYSIVTGYLYQNDSLVRYIPFNKYENDWEIDSLPVGMYKVVLKKDDQNYLEYDQLKVQANCTVNYDISVDKYSYCDKRDSIDLLVDGNVLFMYGSQDISPQPEKIKNEVYKAGFLMNFFPKPNKYCSQAFSWGGTVGYTHFPGDTSSFAGNKIISKRYTTANVCVGFTNRFSFFDFTQYDYDFSGLMIDIGVLYNLPLTFRQVQRLDNNTRVQDRFIHNYTDFHGFVRITYKYVGLQAEYTPLNYLISGYAPNPVLRVGINFTIPGA